MYGQGGIVGGATTTAAGVAVLPNTGGNTLLTGIAITAIVLGAFRPAYYNWRLLAIAGTRSSNSNQGEVMRAGYNFAQRKT